MSASALIVLERGALTASECGDADAMRRSSPFIVRRDMEASPEVCRDKLVTLVRDAIRLLVKENDRNDNEAHRNAACAVLGQLRGRDAVYIVLDELAQYLTLAASDS